MATLAIVASLDAVAQDPWTNDVNCVRWIQRTDVGAPEARVGHVMAYDTHRGVTVLFGGHRWTENFLDLVYFSDTWEYDGKLWRQIIIDGPSPLWRTASAMCYDSVRHEMVLAGGYNSHEAENDGYLYDSWVFRHTEPGHGVWIRKGDLARLLASPRDNQRAGHAMVFDSRRGITVLVGGTMSENSAVDAPDTDRTSQIQERGAESWSYRTYLFGNAYEGPTGHAMVYDSDTETISISGGAYNYFFLRSGSVEWQDLDWPTLVPINQWSGTNHLYRTPVAGKPIGGTTIGARRGHVSAYDVHRKRIVIFGGYIGSADPLPGTEDPGNRLDEAQFFRETDGAPGYVSTRLNIPTPPAREFSAMVYDIRRRCMVLFGGGRGPALMGDTWEYGIEAIRTIYADGSNQGTEDGSLARPFRTVRQAAAALDDCRAVLSIHAGDYPEGALFLDKPVRLEARGGGVVIR